MHKLFEKIFGNPWWGYTVVSAFTAVILFFNVNGYRADKWGINGLLIALGVVFSLATIGFFLKAKATSTGRGG